MTTRHLVAVALAGALLWAPQTAVAVEADSAAGVDGDATTTVELFFPVRLPLDGMSDTWGAPRSGGRSHEGTDIMAPQMAPVYAAVDGEILKAKGEDCERGEACDSYYIALAGDDGRGYFYVHLNNDTPGRPDGCDGVGGVSNAFAPRLVRELAERGTLTGVRVSAGEHIAYNGSSGNAGCGVDHLHFEIWNDSDWASTGKINPYPELEEAIEAGRVHDAGFAPHYSRPAIG